MAKIAKNSQNSSGQKFIKNAKNGIFDHLKHAVKQCYQTGQLKKDKKYVEKKGNFQTM